VHGVCSALLLCDPAYWSKARLSTANGPSGDEQAMLISEARLSTRAKAYAPISVSARKLPDIVMVPLKDIKACMPMSSSSSALDNVTLEAGLRTLEKARDPTCFNFTSAQLMVSFPAIC